MSTTGTDIHKAAEWLHKGELVAIPTETVYGLAANALNTKAVVKIFEAKNRPFFDPLICHTYHIDAINDYVKSVPDWAAQLYKYFAPGPLSVLLPKKSNIPDIVTSGLDTVAFRIPNQDMTLMLLQMVDFPLAAPSANPFGYISPTTAKHVDTLLGNHVPYILDGGTCNIGVESTIVGEEHGKITVYRLGGVSVEEIETMLGKVQIVSKSSVANAPGMLDSHYAPRKKMYIVSDLAQVETSENASILSFDKKYTTAKNLILSPNSDLSEAAQNLFSYLRMLDNDTSTNTIYTTLVPDTGIGKAINDRLVKASYKK
ncbi:MAG: L-threonylcarbamoyladenylate synthase [Cytophagales bacterium]|nr:L-threonylcarbamoyladenylate synthase [Cytophagales bacterium]